MKREALASAVLSLAAVGAALLSQHRWDMQPCPWCVLQRLAFVLIAAAGLATALSPSFFLSRLLALLRALLALGGVAAAMWQHFVAAASESCNLTLADKILAWTTLDGLLPDVFQPRASCAEARVDLLGVPYEFWSAALFALLALMAWRSVRRG